MENKLTERCCLGKFLGEDCDKTTYCRNIGRLDISNFDEKIIDLMQQRSLYNFKTGDTICFYHEKAYNTCYEALQLYCFDLYQVHKKEISKGLRISESAIAVTLKINVIDMVHDGCNCCFSFWAIFCPFTPLLRPKNENFKKMKKTCGDIIILHNCTKNYDYRLYCSCGMACDRCNCYFSFWAIFCPFTPLTAHKISKK